MSSIQHIDNATLKALLAETPPCQLVDVRTTEEHRYLGYIPGARLIPLNELPQRWTELDKTRPVVVTCEHGVRSLDASFYLQGLGFGEIYNLTHGMAAWDGERVH